MSSSPLSSAQAARADIARRLDGIRRDAGISGLELAERCGWHKSKSSRIARGKTPPSDADIRAWCAACGVEDQAADLIAASRTAESMYVHWRQIHKDGMRHVHEKTVPLHQRTRHFRVYASNLVPGILQTADYATGLLRSITDFQGTPDDVERAVNARLARSCVVFEGDHRFALLLEETVLYYRVCDEPAMAAQLGSLSPSEDFARPPQFGILGLQPLDLRGLVGGDAGPRPASTWDLRTHVRTVSAAPMPSFAATAFIAAHSVG
jgi:transcriptional regulator with XRE-family HTH domain